MRAKPMKSLFRALLHLGGWRDPGPHLHPADFGVQSIQAELENIRFVIKNARALTHYATSRFR